MRRHLSGDSPVHWDVPRLGLLPHFDTTLKDHPPRQRPLRSCITDEPLPLPTPPRLLPEAASPEACAQSWESQNLFPRKPDLQHILRLYSKALL